MVLKTYLNDTSWEMKIVTITVVVGESILCFEHVLDVLF